MVFSPAYNINMCFKGKNSLAFFIAFTFFLLCNSILFAQNSSIDSLKKLLDKSDQKTKQHAELCFQLGKEYYKAEEFPAALENYTIAIKEFTSIGDSLSKAQSLRGLATVYLEVNDYQNSLKNYIAANELFEFANNKNEVISTVSDIGELHLKFENLDKAFEYLFKANKYYSKDEAAYKKELLNNYLLLGITYGTAEKIDSSLFYFEKVKALSTIKGNELFYGGVLNNIGAIYSKKNELDKAIYYYNEALSIFRSVNNKRAIGVSLSNIAYIKQKEKKFNDAINLFDEAIVNLKTANDIYNLNDAYYNLSEIYEALGNHEKAYSYAKQYIALNDSINNVEIAREVANIEVQQEIKKKNQEIQIIDQQKQLIEKDNKLKQIWFYLMLGGTVLGAIIVTLFIRNLRISLKHNKLKQIILNQEKMQLVDNLEYKNKELEKFAFHIIEKNELLAKLKEELKSLTNEHQPENEKRVREISSSINNNLQIDKDRKEFEFQLDNIHQSFFLKLDSLYPGLTKSERRLCSLLVLDLSSKNIATILNISPDGVKKSRYRLRKKLNLEEEVNISEFLMKL